MRIGRIGHAGIVVSTGKISCFMDPIVVQPFAGGGNRLYPEVTVDLPSAQASCQAIILSHAHPDHFSIPSLAALPRNVPVFFPRGDQIMEEALRRLKYPEITGMSTGNKFQLEDLEWLPTASKAPAPEVGVSFRSGGLTCWNLVDTVIDDDAISVQRFISGPTDVMIAAYQPLFQEFPSLPSESEFKASVYGALLSAVLDVAPRCVVPGACGFRYTADWLNWHGFPITEAQFLRDLARLAPGIRSVSLPPGGVLDLATLEVTAGGLPFVRREPGAAGGYRWRPTAGIPPLEDPDLFGLGAEVLRREVPRYLDDAFLAALGTPRHAAWLTRMAEMEAVWRLEVVFPSGPAEIRLLDFTRSPLRWLPDDPEVFTKIDTCATASLILGLLRGELDGASANFGLFRFARRLYQPHRRGITASRSDRDEPLMRIIGEGAFRRHVDRSLSRLGY